MTCVCPVKAAVVAAAPILLANKGDRYKRQDQHRNDSRDPYYRKRYIPIAYANSCKLQT